MSTTDKPEVNIQGKAIVDSYEDGFYVMMPDGNVTVHPSKAAVEKAVKKWAARNSSSRKINVCQIEWRNSRLPSEAAPVYAFPFRVHIFSCCHVPTSSCLHMPSVPKPTSSQ